MVIIIVALLILLVGGLIAFFVVRNIKNKKIPTHPPLDNINYSFITSHGIKVRSTAKLNDLNAGDIESWSEDLMMFWNQKLNCPIEDIKNCFAHTKIILYDEQYLERAGIKVNGITWAEDFVIEIATLLRPDQEINGYNSMQKVKALFRHECSHIILGYVGKVEFNNELHHKVFAEMGLGA